MSTNEFEQKSATKDSFNLNLGSRIKLAREYTKHSVDEVARSMKVSTEYINSVESGDITLSIQELLAFSQALKVTPDMLLSYGAGKNLQGRVIQQEYLDVVISILKACTPSERAHIITYMWPMAELYSEGLSRATSFQYDRKRKNTDLQECIRIATECFLGRTRREQKFLYISIATLLLQCKLKMSYTFQAFPPAFEENYSACIQSAYCLSTGESNAKLSFA